MLKERKKKINLKRKKKPRLREYPQLKQITPQTDGYHLDCSKQGRHSPIRIFSSSRVRLFIFLA